MNSNVISQEKKAVREQPQQPQSSGSRRWVQPPVNIVETRDGYTLEAEMPGVNKEGLEVMLDGNELTIVGRKSPFSGQAQLIYRESNDYDFRRVFELDPVIDISRVVARIENGLLRLELPKAEKIKPRKIAVE